MTPRASGSNPESWRRADDRSEAPKSESPKKKRFLMTRFGEQTARRESRELSLRCQHTHAHGV